MIKLKAMEITGIILAGGKSRRMGTDKALISLDGKTLLQRAVDFCRDFCSRIIISSDSQLHHIPGIRQVADEMPGCGPIGGIYSCLKESDTEWNFVLSVDAAYVEKALVGHLKSCLQDFDAVVPIHQGGMEPLIAFYHKNSLPVMGTMLESGNYKMQDFLKNIDTCYTDTQNEVIRYPFMFRNLNSPGDLS